MAPLCPRQYAHKYRNGVLAISHIPLGPLPDSLPFDAATAITCLKVASATTGKDVKEEPSQWVLDSLRITFQDFAIDPLIDLLVLVEPNLNM